MEVHLVDGTYELFRQFFGRPGHADQGGTEVGAVLGVLGSLLDLIDAGATHVGVATDHVIESFRNDLWPGYKTSEGIAPELLAQFGLLEEALGAMGVVLWPMTDLEADDALGAAAKAAAADPAVTRVLLCTPDKDLAQCVVGERVVMLDRRNRAILDDEAVEEKFGVPPASIPDFLALVGDSADGFPGLAGWGRRSAAAVLARYGHLEDIPDTSAAWDPQLSRAVRGAQRLAERLAEDRAQALLFRCLATLVVDPAPFAAVSELRWSGPGDEFEELCVGLRAPALAERARAAAARAG